MSAHSAPPKHLYATPHPGQVMIQVHGGLTKDVIVARVTTVAAKILFDKEGNELSVESWQMWLHYGVHQYVSKSKGDGWNTAAEWHLPTLEESRWSVVKKALAVAQEHVPVTDQVNAEAAPVPKPRRLTGAPAPVA